MIPRFSDIKEFWLKNERHILLAITFICVFMLGFFTAYVKNINSVQPVIKIEKSPIHSSILKNGVQSQGAVNSVSADSSGCEGKVKGNVSSSGKIYHIPGGAFYARTNPEICFENEQEALQAGFRKSKR